jgi:nucleoside-diphosphate-sugar epimerase
MKKVLITGGAGFIGSAITTHLISQGFDVLVLDDHSRQERNRLNALSGLYQPVQGDVRDLELVKKVVSTVDSVVHLAYINGTSSFYEIPARILDVAIEGMQNLVEAVKNSNVEEFYLASSSEVYQQAKVIPTPEEVELSVPDPFNPRFSYGLGKIVQEFMLIHSLGNIRKKVIFRPHNIYGPDMGTLHVLPELFLKISEAQSGVVKLKGDGKQTRSFCEIGDFIQAFNLLIKNEFAKPEIFNIGTHYEVTIDELGTLISKNLGKSINFEHSNSPLGETKRRLPDISKIAALGFKPTIDIEKGISNYRSWFDGYYA